VRSSYVYASTRANITLPPGLARTPGLPPPRVLLPAVMSRSGKEHDHGRDGSLDHLDRCALRQTTEESGATTCSRLAWLYEDRPPTDPAPRPPHRRQDPCEWTPGPGWRSHRAATSAGRPRSGGWELDNRAREGRLRGTGLGDTGALICGPKSGPACAGRASPRRARRGSRASGAAGAALINNYGQIRQRKRPLRPEAKSRHGLPGLRSV
jgi:hypothetical protein